MKKSIILATGLFISGPVLLAGAGHPHGEQGHAQKPQGQAKKSHGHSHGPHGHSHAKNISRIKAISISHEVKVMPSYTL